MYEDKILYAKPLAEKIKSELKSEVLQLKENHSYTPSLLVFQVGDNPASNVYIKNKQKDAEEIGVGFEHIRYPADIEEVYLLKDVEEHLFKHSPDGVIIQLPLPSHISTEAVIDRNFNCTDVDCMTSENIGNLLKGNCTMPPCTPAGVIELLKTVTDLKGKHCVVVGRSNIVGKPLALMLLDEDATVTVCHSKTENLKKICSEADILITAIGKAKYFTEEYVKEGAIVIDVGINRDENGKLCGDVDFDNVIGKVSKITPVPGGVGLMTRAMLMKNVVTSAKTLLGEG